MLAIFHRLSPAFWVGIVILLIGVNLLAYWQYRQAKQYYRAVSRVAITEHGTPVRPIGEITLWLNAQPFGSDEFRANWRPFISSQRYENTKRRTVVLVTDVNVSRQSELSDSQLKASIERAVTALLERADQSLPVTSDAIEANSFLISVSPGGSKRSLLWSMGLGSLFVVLLVLNIRTMSTTLSSRRS